MEPKLVRDKVPGLIRASGADPIMVKASDHEYQDLLMRKLREEVQEFIEAQSLEELADILEVVRTLATAFGFEHDQLEQMRVHKASERGGFEGKLVWKGNRPLGERASGSKMHSSAGHAQPQG